jgi:hypothetical protein
MVVDMEIKSRLAMTKATFSKKSALFTSKLDLSLRKKPAQMVHRFCGAESWALYKLDQKYLESFEIGC